MTRLLRSLAVGALALCAFTAPALADGRFILDEENDSIGKFGDQHYTQGLRLGYLTDTLDSGSGLNAPFAWLSPFFEDQGTRRVGFSIGQSMFTPAKLSLVIPDPNDRPYAGWLYGAADFLEQTSLDDGHMLEHFGIQLGVIGPASVARQAQDAVHSLIGDHQPLGWAYQLSNEPGVVVSYERKWRLEHQFGGGFSADIIPEAGVTVGNVLTYADAGIALRIGQNAEVDYGPSHIQPGQSGTDFFDDAAIGPNSLGWYLFASAQGRLVGRNIFLDGNTFATSRSVSKKIGVADFTVGGSLYWSHHVKLDITFNQRSPEFDTQVRRDRFGMVTISFGL